MLSFEHDTVFGIARNIKAFLSLKVGITRDGMSEFESLSTLSEIPNVPGSSDPQAQKLQQVSKQLTRIQQENASLRSELAAIANDTEGARLHAENITWNFGSERTGSTWLGRMMGKAGHTPYGTSQ